MEMLETIPPARKKGSAQRSSYERSTRAGGTRLDDRSDAYRK
jgi:hypothetical protein